MPLSALERAANVQVVGLSVLVYAISAWPVHRGRHVSYAWLVQRLFPNPTSALSRHASALFLYLACWLFPVWLLQAMSLRQPAPRVADYGLALALHLKQPRRLALWATGLLAVLVPAARCTGPSWRAMPTGCCRCAEPTCADTTRTHAQASLA